MTAEIAVAAMHGFDFFGSFGLIISEHSGMAAAGGEFGVVEEGTETEPLDSLLIGIFFGGLDKVSLEASILGGVEEDAHGGLAVPAGTPHLLIERV